MPYIKKRGITYGGFPNATVASKEATAIVPSSIKQLTRVGGTQEFAPVTIPEAVKFSEGGSLETTVNSIATIESSSTASKAYVVGDFLVSGGQLYKVIADIAVGETFVVDTNIESTSVGSELSALNAGLANVGTFPDYSNPIFSGNVNSGTDVYTATQDCCVFMSLYDGGRLYRTFYINGTMICDIAVFGGANNSVSVQPISFYMKAGDILTTSVAFNTTHYVHLTVLPISH